MRVAVHLVPGRRPVSRAAAAVVVDVLRATTTLATALHHGAARVLPVAEIDEARSLKRRHPEALLCGERDGRKIPGFDLGNSPDEYSPQVVAGRTLIFASTNGSRALLHAAPARRRLLGAFINASAVLEALSSESEIAIICAGQLGHFSLEDAAFAGLMCERLASCGASFPGDDAGLARRLAPRDAAEVRALVQGSAHGRTLRRLGPEFARDVETCAGLDALDRAPDI